MKKIKLLLAAVAAMVTMGVNAQSWTASEVGAGNYYLYNVGKGQFLTRGNGWGTQASVDANSALTLTIEEYNGAYKLRTNINGSGKGLERLGDPVIYTDQSAGKNSTWTFTKVADASNGPVYTIVSAENHQGGSGSYMTASADNTIVGPADAVTDDYGRWQLVQSWITNSVPVNDATGWTTSQAPAFDGGNVNAEFWNKSGASIKQTISNLPAGNYDLIAVALTREGMTATLNAGINTKSIATVGSGTVNNRTQAKDWFNAGNGVNTIEFTHAGGNLEIGLTADNANGDHWLVWRSFVLIYKGVALSELKAALQAQINAVPALEGTTTTAAYNAAKNYADGINVEELTTEEAISNASTELNNLVSAAKALQNAYAGYLVIKTAVEALDDDASIYSGDATIDISEIDAPVQATTTLDALNAAIATAKPQLQVAAADFLTAVTVNDGKRFDITNIYLTNADFEVPTANGQMPPGWNITITGQNCGQQNRTDTNPATSLAITNFIEAWHPSQLGNGVIAQTVSSLPEGTYVLECDASICHDPEGADDITGANLYIQSSLKTERQAISNVRLYINHYSLEFVHGGVGSVTFGLEANNTNANWLSADNFKVYYAGGVDLSIYEDALAEAVGDFEALESVSLPANYATYKAVVDANNITWSNSAEYQAAIDAVHEATTDLEAINALVASYNSALAAAKVTVAKENKMRASLRTGLSNAITTYEGNVDMTNASALESATTALTTATGKCETSIASYAIIAAGSIPDNSIDGWYCENTQTFHVNTWSVEGDTDGSNMKTPFIENWVGKGSFLGEGKVYYRLEGLEPGESYYAQALVRSYNEANADAPNGPNFYINDTESNLSSVGTTFTFNGMSGIYATLSAVTTIGDDGVLELGVIIAADRNYNWVAFKNVKIMNYGDVAINEGVDYTPVPMAANVTLTRTIKADKWNSFVVPFDISNTDLKAAFGDDVEVAEFSDEGENADAVTVNFTKMETPAITANTPVLLKGTPSGSNQYVFTTRVIDTNEAVKAGTYFDFKGTYKASSTIDSGDYFIGDSKLYKSAGTTTIKGTRAYLHDKTGGAGVKLFIDGQAFDYETAIDGIEAAPAQNGAIYNIAGQRVSKAQKGIFIVNGKKIVK